MASARLIIRELSTASDVAFRIAKTIARSVVAYNPGSGVRSIGLADESVIDPSAGWPLECSDIGLAP